MFNREVYIARRAELVRRMAGQKGLILILGNVDSPAQYADNCYRFRQDSNWLYFFGLDEPRHAAVIDLETGRETLFADDVDINDIIWTGPMPSVQSMAESAGVSDSQPYCKIDWVISEAIIKGRPVHTVPQSRCYNRMKLQSLGVDGTSEALIRAIISMRLVKDPLEIAEMDHACNLGYAMHTAARRGIRPGRIEQEIVGEMEGVAIGTGWGTSFSTILTQHGEIFHCHSHECPVEPGKLLVVDAGVESNSHYASDFTRTYPTGGKYTSRQRDIYQIVSDCHDLAFSMTKPGTSYREVHIAASRLMLESLSSLGLVHGNIDAMVEQGIAGLFMPHGLGHNIGLDCHDMEDMGEDLVGYDPDQKRSDKLGLRSLRMARRLVPGNVVSDEPGIYFIPDLIEKWKHEGTGREFVNFDKLVEYYDFGGIRLEDDVLVTEDGARRLGDKRLPATVSEVEEAMAQDKN